MEIFKLDETSGWPVWVQLRNRMIYLIKTGYYAPGSQLPTVRGLAAQAGVNYNTVSKAYVDLEHSGYVVSIKGKGVFVRKAVSNEEADLISAVDVLIEDCVRKAMTLGMPLDDVRKRMADVTAKIEVEASVRANEKGSY